MIDLEHNLINFHKDALKEIGNIGAGNAATAFSELLATKIDMTVPSVEIIPIVEVPEVTVGLEEKILSVLLNVSGKAPGSILLVLSESSTTNLLKIILGKDIDLNKISEVEISAIKEIGNILSGSYLRAINQITDLDLVQSVPGFSYDMAAAILSTSMVTISEESDFALLIETQFMIDSEKIEGFFFFIPNPGSLEKILQSLGLAPK